MNAAFCVTESMCPGSTLLCVCGVFCGLCDVISRVRRYILYSRLAQPFNVWAVCGIKCVINRVGKL